MSSKTEFKEYSHHLLMIGDVGVGKTKLIQSYRKCESEVIPTQGAVFYVLPSPDNLQAHHFRLWEFSGATEHEHRKLYYQMDKTRAIIFVFDLSNENTLNDIAEILKADRDILPKCPMILCGTKSDLKDARQVAHKKAERFAKDHGMTYMETSVVDNTKVTLLFEHAMQAAKDLSVPKSVEDDNDEISIDSELYSEDSNCRSGEESSTACESWELKVLRNYVDVLSSMDEKSFSKNNLKAGKAKANYLKKNLLNDEYIPDEKEVRGLLKHNYGKVLDNRNRFGIKLYKIRSLFFGCRNEFQKGRLCESKTEELLVKYYENLKI